MGIGVSWNLTWRPLEFETDVGQNDLSLVQRDYNSFLRASRTLTQSSSGLFKALLPSD